MKNADLLSSSDSKIKPLRFDKVVLESSEVDLEAIK